MKYGFIVFLGVLMSTAYATPPNITLIADPKVLKISIKDNQEPLVDIRKEKALLYGSSPEIENNTNYFFMRKTVYEKLKQANALLPKGVRICLYEGYRSLDLQKKIFDQQYSNVVSRHIG